MRNEVYGKVELAVSVPVKSNNESLGVLEANYIVNDLRFVDCELRMTDSKGSIHNVKVHDWDILLEKYFKD